jgi:hypothetical protein
LKARQKYPLKKLLQQLNKEVEITDSYYVGEKYGGCSSLIQGKPYFLHRKLVFEIAQLKNTASAFQALGER